MEAKIHVLGRVLAYFSYTNEGQLDLDLYTKNRLKLVQNPAKNTNFRLKNYPETVQLVLSEKNVIFA